VSSKGIEHNQPEVDLKSEKTAKVSNWFRNFIGFVAILSKNWHLKQTEQQVPQLYKTEQQKINSIKLSNKSPNFIKLSNKNLKTPKKTEQQKP
jgi:hypothetical protein